ncbi:MAG: hypothetical protein JO060_07035 [Candidatus Eremiobacteraeota bacterium]|nr:hypothetical protein [Candidatus Eremiobacteraeota bacterium]
MTIRTLLLVAALLPLAACGQNAQNAQTSQGTESQLAAQASFSPAMRAQMQRIRLDTKNATLKALTPEHRRAVSAAANDFNTGAASVPEAANKIDAILTPAETSAVMAQQRKMRSEMRTAFANSGEASGTRRFGGSRRARRTPDAGRFLVQLLADPEKWRAAMQAAAPATPSP